MKVVQINTVCGIGSTGRIASDISNKLSTNNIENYIAYGRETSIESEQILRIGTKLDIYIHGLLTRLFDAHALMGSRNATHQLIKQLRKINPDIVHLHNLHGYYLNVKVLFEFLKEVRKPVVWTLHDCWSFTGHCAYFSFAECEKWRVGCKECTQRASYPSSIRDSSDRNFSVKKQIFTSLENLTIVTPSEWLSKLVGESFLSKYPVKVINNGIDINVFKPAEDNPIREKYKLGQRFIILGVASKWDRRKGLNYFLELSKKFDDSTRIVLVGLDEKQILDLPRNVIGISRTSNINELSQIYSAADVFFNPTLEDNFPTVNLEALACGTPVITFDSGGSAESLDGDCGYVVKKGDINRVFILIEEIRKRGKTYFSKSCIRRVRNNFNKNDRYDDYLKLFMSIDANEERKVKSQLFEL